MGVIYKNEYRDECILGIWKITETYDELRQLLTLDRRQQKTLNGFGSLNRKIEWLSVRALLSELTNSSTRILYNGERKPLLEDGSYNISISHSDELTSILLSRNRRVGIDLEHMTHRIELLASKFLNDSEEVTNDPFLQRYHLYIHWCAKEALFKICDKKNINFRENLIIHPFELKDEGKILGTVWNEHIHETFNLQYFKLENYSIVWCCKE